MVSRAEAFPTRFLQSANVKAAPGGRLVDIIQYVDMEEMPARDGRPAQSKPVIYLQHSKPLVCNITNFNVIADELGDETDNWAGAKIALVVRKVTMGRDTVDGIRVDKVARVVSAAPAKQEPPPISNNNVFDDDIGF
jgi:hypothetical protein